MKVPNPKPAECDNGYIHLLANGVEVRDMQHLFGLLADEGVTSNTRIGVVGQSYGGGMALQLGTLKNRISNEAGVLSPWKSPGGKDMSIAAAAPEFGWSNLVYGLIPNGAFYDYASLNPYKGPSGDRRAGVAKLGWVERLYGGGLQTGFYSNSDERYDVPDIRQALLTGGPYDANTEIQDAINAAERQSLGLRDRRFPGSGAAAAGPGLERRSVPGLRGAALLQQDAGEVPDRAAEPVRVRLRAHPAGARSTSTTRRRCSPRRGPGWTITSATWVRRRRTRPAAST